MELQFVAFGGGLQVAGQRALGPGLLVHFALIPANRAALLGLAAIHRKLGIAQHLIAFGGVDREYRIADRGGEGDLLVLRRERLGKHRGDPLGKRLGVVRVVAGHLQAQKFVAALAR